jgi:hypothetical protein
MGSVRIFVGIVLAVAGAVWVVDRLGGTPEAAAFLTRWSPALLVVLGGLQAWTLLRRSRLLAPVSLILGGLGGLLIVHAEADVAGPLFWPLAMVVAGLALALAQQERRENDEPVLREASLLRTRTVVRTEREFEVAEIRAVLGNLRLDLTRCQLGADAEIQVFVVLGHVGLVVPDGYLVALQADDAIAVDVPPTLPPVDSDPDAILITISVLGVGGTIDVQRAWVQTSPSPRDSDDDADVEEDEGEDATASASAPA